MFTKRRSIEQMTKNCLSSDANFDQIDKVTDKRELIVQLQYIWNMEI